MNERRVLIIEDEFLVACEIRSILQDAGIDEVVLAAAEAAALKEIRHGRWDAVIADANLNGAGIGRIVAAILDQRIPFLLVSGYDTQSLPAQIREAPRLAKPFLGPELMSMLTEIMA